MDRGACQAILHGIAKSRTRLKQLSTHHARSNYSPITRSKKKKGNYNSWLQICVMQIMIELLTQECQ